MKDIILASGSPRRRELLAQAGIPFTVITSAADETIDETDPAAAVMELARRKAAAVLKKAGGERIVLGADTVVAVDGRILGKPADAADAARMLRALSGRTHRVFTGVALLAEGRERVFCEETEVEMYPISEEEIRDYIATGEPMDKAGAYGIQGRAAVFVKGIRGDYLTVVGLPLARLYQELKGWM